jgi:hypothetical protein
MYANQRVRILGKGGRIIETLSAWRVEIASTGRVRVHLDDDDGPDEKYANPAGVRDLPLGTRVSITTDF